MGEKQVNLKLRKEAISIRTIGQSLGISYTIIWKFRKKKENIGALSNRHRTRRRRKATTDDDRNIMRALIENLKTTFRYVVNNFHSAGVNVS